MYIRKMRRPKTVPCGIPDKTVEVSDKETSKMTSRFLPSITKKSFNQIQCLTSHSIMFQFSVKAMVLILSKAFENSIT